VHTVRRVHDDAQVCTGGDAFTMETMRMFLAEKGVARQYWPERLELMAELPHIPSRKIRKFALRDLLGGGSSASELASEPLIQPASRYEASSSRSEGGR
jgi:hypothetical protein